MKIAKPEYKSNSRKQMNAAAREERGQEVYRRQEAGISRRDRGQEPGSEGSRKSS